MDKETLSNYGWIVIAVLVLVVMIALATPFGSFISEAVQSTTKGLFDVNKNALDAAGVPGLTVQDQEFDVPDMNHGAENGGAGDQGGSALPVVGTSAEDCTWDEIKAISEAGKGDEYFNLGDTKTFTLTDGTSVVMEIVAFNADTKADGNGTAGITWLSKDLIAEHPMNVESGSLDSWDTSDMRSWLQSEVYNTLPAELKAVIVEVNKTYYDYTAKSTLSCNDKVWIPSVREMFGSNNVETSGATYASYFTDSASRVKHYSDRATCWWLRSANGIFSIYFRGIDINGNNSETAYGANNYYGVSLGFCT